MEWNDLRIAELTRMWRDGFSASQVARQLGGISRSAVIGKVHRLGISCRSAPSRPRATAVRMPNGARASAGGVRRKAAQSRAPTLAIAKAVEAFATATATVLTLTEMSCRWPIGDPGQAEFGFCGRARAGRGPYCEGHGQMGLRHRDKGMKIKEIDRLVRRQGESPSHWSSLEASHEATQAAALALALAQ